MTPVTWLGVRPRSPTDYFELVDPLCQELASAERAASLRLIIWNSETPMTDDLEARGTHVEALCPSRTSIHSDYYDVTLRDAVALASKWSGDDERAVRSSP